MDVELAENGLLLSTLAPLTRKTEKPAIRHIKASPVTQAPNSQTTRNPWMKFVDASNSRQQPPAAITDRIPTHGEVLAESGLKPVFVTLTRVDTTTTTASVDVPEDTSGVTAVITKTAVTDEEKSNGDGAEAGLFAKSPSSHISATRPITTPNSSEISSRSPQPTNTITNAGQREAFKSRFSAKSLEWRRNLVLSGIRFRTSAQSANFLLV